MAATINTAKYVYLKLKTNGEITRCKEPCTAFIALNSNKIEINIKNTRQISKVIGITEFDFNVQFYILLKLNQNLSAKTLILSFDYLFLDISMISWHL